MTKHLSQTDLEKIYKAEVKKVGIHRFEEVKKNLRNNIIKVDEQPTMFLCHSHIDKTIVNKVLALFNTLGVNIYIDWMDSSLPRETDKNTGSIIKQKIENSDKFLFLATYNALRSKWCNWELGLAYSAKGETDFAVLPIESKSGKWSGNEYLALYPEMQIELDRIEALTAEDIAINFYGDKKVSFNNWLNNRI